MKPLIIGDLTAKLPIIQGGMGIGVSLSRLASAVANEGGIGVISGVQIGFRDPNFKQNPIKANLKAIGEEIAKARKLSPNGIIGMNFMSIDPHYNEYVAEAVKHGIDLIISGAGLPLALPKLVKNSKTKIMPIVSSVRACRLVLTSWLKKDNRIPDGIVVEGPKAGGHLGFKMEDLQNGTMQTLDEALTDVVNFVKDFEQKNNVKIPVVAAGGINSHEDIERVSNLGASGVQIGTAFVATEECDASDDFKQTYVNAKPEDARIILSPTGFPARAVNTDFVKNAYDTDGIAVKHCYGCMTGICNPKTTRYCLSDALFTSALGTGGLVFCGERVGEITEITTVHKLIQKLCNEPCNA